MQDQRRTSIHWFDPFGSTSFDDIKSEPKIQSIPYPGPNNTTLYWEVDHRILFWDQEPLHRDRAAQCLDSFCATYNSHNKYRTLVTSEYCSEDVQWAQDTYGLKPAYYFFHAWASLDWYRGYNHSYLIEPFEYRRPRYTFLCPNNIIGGCRRHRLELLSELVDRELVYNNLVSFPDRCPYENKSVTELCHEYDIDMAAVDLPLKIDHGADYHSGSHQIDMWSLASQSLLHVVTETVYNGRKQHLTEKTFKPIVMQQPFVLVSCRGSLEYLRRYGFKTFNDVWDESYDDASDELRILKIGKLLSDLHNLSSKEKQQLQKHLMPIVKHNYNWFYSNEYQSLLWEELTTMVNQWFYRFV